MNKKENSEIERLLKEESKDFTPDLLDKIKRTPVYVLPSKEETRNIILKPVLTLLSIFIAMFILFGVPTTAGVIYNDAYESITIDVNPSIELRSNLYGTVIEYNLNNDDAKSCYKDIEFTNMTVEQAINTCVDRLYDNGYINELNDYNMIIISGYGFNHDFSQRRMNTIQSYVNDSMDKKNRNCNYDMFPNYVSKDQMQEFRQTGKNDFGRKAIIDRLEPFENREDCPYKDGDFENYSMKELKDFYYFYYMPNPYR